MKPLFFFAAVFCLAGCARHRQTARTIVTPSTPAAIQRQIKNAIDAGDGDYELAAFRERVIANPADLPARLRLAQAYAKRGCPELALDHYRLAAERFPNSSDAILPLAKSLNQSGRGLEAASVLEKFLASHPRPGAELYSWLGIVRDDNGDWKGGERAHREALAIANRDYLHNNLGYALLMQGHSAEAAAEFRAALKLNPGSVTARNNLGVALAGNPKEAILNWQSMGEPAAAHSNLAAVLIEQGDYAGARKELQIALEYNRSNPAALSNLKLLSELDGQPATIPRATPLATTKSPE